MAVSDNKRPEFLIPRSIFDEDFFAEKLRDSERRAKLMRPLRNVYLHIVCGCITKLSLTLAVELAKRPKDFTGLRCVACGFRPIHEYLWDGTRDICGM